jgi:hypothetical protein
VILTLHHLYRWLLMQRINHVIHFAGWQHEFCQQNATIQIVEVIAGEVGVNIGANGNGIL